MSRRDIWAYNPEVCDGGPCPMNCQYCQKREKAEEAAARENGEYVELDEPNLELGFNPYMGCYDYDC